MENNMQRQFATQTVGLNGYLRKVFGWMAIGVFVTFVVSFATSLVPSFAYMVNSGGFMGVLLSLVIQFGLIMYMQHSISNLSVSKARGAFLIYSAITGLNFSVFFVLMNLSQIFMAFLMAALFFGSLCVIGYTTKINLTKWGTLLFATLIAFVGFQLVALLFHFEVNNYWIAYIGLIIFALYTAYDMQYIKKTYYAIEGDSLATDAYAVYGAFQLYLDFLNIFIYILQLLASSSDD